MKDVMCPKIMENLLNDPKMRQAAEEIFKYVVQPSCEVKYNEELLSLRDKININTLFLLNQLDGGNDALNEGKIRQLNEQKSNRNTEELN